MLQLTCTGLLPPAVPERRASLGRQARKRRLLLRRWMDESNSGIAISYCYYPSWLGYTYSVQQHKEQKQLYSLQQKQDEPQLIYTHRVSRRSKANPADMSHDSRSTLSKLAPLEAILFDIDGTLCDSDPIHFCAFREVLQQVGFNNGDPITEEFYSANISGGHNDDLARALFPGLDHGKAMKFIDDKEALFRKLAPEQLKAVDGLHDLCRWIEGRNLKHAAVTNAPRSNAELMLSLLGLSDFFQVLVIGSECDRAKPFPDPYLKALELIDASPDHTFIFEDSASGIRAGVAAGVPVVGLTTRNPEKVLNDAGASLLIKDFQDPKLLSVLEELEPTIAKMQG